jgi:Dolichyl-phosphate-mannose-protein mannosyltransferase
VRFELADEEQPVWLPRVLWLGLTATAAYTVTRAFFLKAEYYDGYSYLLNASLVAGERIGEASDLRPPLLSLLQLPVVVVCRALGPANPWLLRGPHLLSAALAVGSAAAVVWMLTEVFGTTLALLGGVLFVASRAFFHYGAHVMTDLPVTGLCALSLALHLHAVQTRRLAGFACAGAALGAAVGMKYSAAVFGVVLVMTELGAIARVETGPGVPPRLRLRFDGHRWVGVVLEAAASVALVVIAETVMFTRIYGWAAWPRLVTAMQAAKRAVDRLPGESWQDNLPMLLTMLSIPLMAAAAVGLIAALAKPRRADVSFWAWLSVMGAFLLFVVGHNEARYLLPVVPAIVYFAVRGVEATAVTFMKAAASVRVRRNVVAAGVALLAASVFSNGISQAWEDRDPVFYRDLQGRAARELLAFRRRGGPAYVVGNWHTLWATTPGSMRQDEFWNVFHGAPFVVAYLLGEPVVPLAGNGSPFALRDQLLARAGEGDGVIRFDDVFYMTAWLPPGGRYNPIEVWHVHRQDLVPSGPDRRLAPAQGSGPGAALRVEGAQVSLVPEFSSGPWWIFARSGPGSWTYVATSALSAGEPIPLPSESTAVTGIALLSVDVSQIR